MLPPAPAIGPTPEGGDSGAGAPRVVSTRERTHVDGMTAGLRMWGGGGGGNRLRVHCQTQRPERGSASSCTTQLSVEGYTT